MRHFGDLFSARQKLAVTQLSELTANLKQKLHAKEALTLALIRSANALSSLCRWHVSGEKHEGVYSRQALPIVWDFSEANPPSEATSSYAGATDWVADVAEKWPGSRPGAIQCADACHAPLPDDTADTWFTDPPYYDAVPYADLSDFFFVWLRRTLPVHPLLRDPFDADNLLTPKTREIVQDEVKQFEGPTKG